MSPRTSPSCSIACSRTGWTGWTSWNKEIWPICTGTGRVFLVEDPETEQARLEDFEISPSGPVYGFQGLLAQGAPGEAETALIRSEGVDLALFNMPGGLKSRGTRRPYRFAIQDPAMTIEGSEATLSFALPKGSYATLVLRELTKNEDPFTLMAMPG